MTPPLLVLRPEPGNRATVDQARALGLPAIACPLFAIAPVEWAVPDPRRYDAILFTSANALRHAGAGLAALTALPALAVGQATAEAARGAGFAVAQVGRLGVDALVAEVPADQRLLHLAGADRHAAASGHAIDARTVYRSAPLEAVEIPPGPAIALVHSARAGTRLAQLAPDRATLSIAAISEAAAAACGDGWAGVAIAAAPSDGALLALAARLCQDCRP